MIYRNQRGGKLKFLSFAQNPLVAHISPYLVCLTKFLQSEIAAANIERLHKFLVQVKCFGEILNF